MILRPGGASPEGPGCRRVDIASLISRNVFSQLTVEYYSQATHHINKQEEVIPISTETVKTENVLFQFDDRIASAILKITDTETGASIVLDSEKINKAAKIDKITAESILREFSRKIGHDWRQ